jgi:hypothetical protein
MRKLILLTLALQSFGVQALATKLTKDQLGLIDPRFVEQKQLACEGSREKKPGFHDWLAQELALLGYSDFFKENTKTLKWKHEVLEFKVGGDAMEVQTLSSAPGTFGTINDKSIKYGNQEAGKKIVGQFISVGEGVPQELKERTDLAGKVWLMEYNPQVANPLALVFEAKSKKALAVVFYQKKKQELPASPVLMPLPVVFISVDDADEIKNQIKDEPLELSMSIRSDFPVEEQGEHFYVRRETSQVPVLVTADSGNCRSVATVLGMLDWIKKSNAGLQRTSFLFTNNREAFKQQHPEWFGRWAQDLSVETMAARDFKTLLVDWFKTDQSVAGKIDVTGIFNKITQISTSLRGIIDADSLKKFRENLARLKSHPHMRMLPQAYQISQMLTPTAQLKEMANDLNTLRELHYFVRSGQWNKAKGTCKKIAGFELAEQMSSQAFLEFHGQANSHVNPRIWILLDEGKQNLEALLGLIEKDIDNLNKQMADHFLKIEKDLQKLSSVEVSSG